jgi:hypothetical protein
MKYSKYERGLIKFGFELAKENAELSYYRGCGNSCCPPETTIDWAPAEKELEREFALDEE